MAQGQRSRKGLKVEGWSAIWSIETSTSLIGKVRALWQNLPSQVLAEQYSYHFKQKIVVRLIICFIIRTQRK
jgi:hypothetical protein